MEPYLKISFINDFIFCPRSLYFHNLFGSLNSRLYQRKAQVAGSIAHKTVDNKTYSTSTKILQGIEVYSAKYKIAGKIDTFDIQKKILTERKKKIVKIYDGYIYQLYAQYFCLKEMGYNIEKIRLYSMDDNKTYPIKLPEQDHETFLGFENILKEIRAYSLEDKFFPNKAKCKKCIYFTLCDYSVC